MHAAMFRECVHDYGSLPNAFALKQHEIRFFYDGLRPALKTATAAKKT